MKCPKCGREMVSGFLHCNRDSTMYWVSKILPFGLAFWKDDTVLVSERLINGSSLPTFICKECKVLVSDYGET